MFGGLSEKEAELLQREDFSLFDDGEVPDLYCDKPKTPPSEYRESLSSVFAQRGVSDVHVSLKKNEEKLSGWMRINSVLVKVDEFYDDLNDTKFSWMLRAEGNCEKSMGLGDKRLRIAKRTVMEGRGTEVYFRVLPNEIPDVAHRLKDILEPVMTPSHGIFLVSGITGSGKSTLLASLAQNYINTAGSHIVTIEDPIEYVFTAGNYGYASQRDVGSDVESFADGVKKSLRDDPDVILVGEIRDAETAAVALTAAETGHMVLATVHAPGCFGAIDRYLAMLGEADYQAMRFSAGYLGGVHIESFAPLSADRGVSRTYEVFYNNDASRTHIRERKTHQLGQSRNVAIKKTLEG